MSGTTDFNAWPRSLAAHCVLGAARPLRAAPLSPLPAPRSLPPCRPPVAAPSACREPRAGSLAHPRANRPAASVDVSEAGKLGAFGRVGGGDRRARELLTLGCLERCDRRATQAVDVSNARHKVPATPSRSRQVKSTPVSPQLRLPLQHLLGLTDEPKQPLVALRFRLDLLDGCS